MMSERRYDKDVNEQIVLAHGGGGELTKSLLEEHIIPKLGNDILNKLDDSAVLEPASGPICMTTDAFVVQPLEFPGGDIGSLAVCGTVNDLAVMGAVPMALSLALVIEEGLTVRRLDKVIDSIAESAKEASVRIVTGDTKVIEHQRGDGMTITTSGLGTLLDGAELGTDRVSPGDVILINGRIAEHGLAVMSVREGLNFDTELRSDVAPLNSLIQKLIDGKLGVKFMRDPTRGGLAGVLADIVDDTGFSIEIEESSVPITPVARHTAEMLGLDPLTVANEGKVVIVASAEDAKKVLNTCRKHKYGKHTAVIGRVVERKPPLVELITRVGGRRIIQRPYGEELPRIC